MHISLQYIGRKKYATLSKSSKSPSACFSPHFFASCPTHCLCSCGLFFQIQPKLSPIPSSCLHPVSSSSIPTPCNKSCSYEQSLRLKQKKKKKSELPFLSYCLEIFPFIILVCYFSTAIITT